MSHFPAIYLMTSHSFGESVGWDVKWCHMSRITIPLARKRPFHWISKKSGLVRAARESSKFQNWSLISNICHLYMAEILPIYLNKRPIGHIAHLRKQLKSISTYDFTVTLIKRKNLKFMIIYWFLIWRNLNPLHPMMLCAKIVWNWHSGSREEDFLILSMYFHYFVIIPP